MRANVIMLTPLLLSTYDEHMEEQSPAQQPVILPVIPDPPPEAPRILTAQPEATQMVYATALQRFAAALVDGLIISVGTTTISFSANLVTGGNQTAKFMSSIFTSILSLSLTYGYYVYFTGKTGQTLGKKMLHIKVITTNGEIPGYGTAAIRETIGKFISSIALSLGYLWMLWDEKKQTWHDKIANTLVVKTP